MTVPKDSVPLIEDSAQDTTVARITAPITHSVWLKTSIKAGCSLGYRTVNGITTPYNLYSPEEIAQNAVSGWMSSPGHRQNILDSSYDRAGVGIAIADDGKVLFTQNFC